jgi:hypothetical protein
MPMTHGGDHSSTEARQQAAVRAVKCFELVKRGASYAAAGRAVGMTTVAARRAYLRILQGVPLQDAREWRALQLERYGDALLKVNGYMDTHPDKVPECIRVIGHLLNGMNEILGLKKKVVKVQEQTSALPLHWARLGQKDLRGKRSQNPTSPHSFTSKPLGEWREVDDRTNERMDLGKYSREREKTWFKSPDPYSKGGIVRRSLH